MQYVQGETYMFGRRRGRLSPRCFEKNGHTHQAEKGKTEEPLNWQYDLSPSSPLYPFVSHFIQMPPPPPCLIEKLYKNTLMKSEMLQVTVEESQGGTQK